MIFDVLRMLNAIWWSMMLCSWKLQLWPADYVRWVSFSLDITLGQLKSSFKQSLPSKNQTIWSSNAFSQFSELLPRVKPTSITWLPHWWPFRKTPVEPLSRDSSLCGRLLTETQWLWFCVSVRECRGAALFLDSTQLELFGVRFVR